MNDDFLKIRLERVVRRYQWLGLWRKLAACWAAAALVGVAVGWAQRAMGSMSSLTLPIVVALAGGVAATLVLLHFFRKPDLRWVAQKIESRHPELNGVLLTAIQQQLDGNELGYLQYRVLQEATARSQEQDWRDVVPGSRLLAVHAVHLVALACFVYALSGLKVTRIHGEMPQWVSADGVSVSPGDASIERGDSLVVLARFGSSLPPSVSLVLRESGSAPRTVPLVKSLADPVFGGSVAEVANDFTYHLEYRGQRTRDFKVTVFEHPRLVRSDVALKFPDYTKLPPKQIEDTRRVSAVEGTQLNFALQLNKPVKSAKLIARDGKKTEVPLTVSPDKAVATLPDFVPVKTQSYDLQLIDAEGRANKIAAPFTIDVQPNRPPEIRLASPRGDVRPSALEEITFDGTVWDDFGAPAYGIAYSLVGGEPKFLELGKEAGAREKRSFAHLLNLEELGAKPDDLISWYAWADDVGPDGKIRRTNGDLFFAEVRPFDEIFRESQNMESGEQQQQGGGGGQGNQSRRLTELQKQIINATWKLQREGQSSKYADDTKVVLEAQEQALAQATEAAGEARGPNQQALWTAATQEMEKAIGELKRAAKSPEALAQALSAEQAAYQALLKLQARETAVTRRNRGGGGGGGGGGNQRQIDQLDLQQSENRYETQRQARSPQNQERREQLAVMNRLQELARRQQDLNERLKELQTALQEARTEQEREDVRRRLKRLEEEQRQMVADADELRQRMDRQENQSAMTQQREQLDQTRDDLQRAADATADGSVPQALAAGTRAQRQLQQARDEMRKQNSSEFAEDLREMRSEARDLANQQEALNQQLDQLARGGQSQRKQLGGPDEKQELADKLAQQRDRMDKLMDRATQLSEQAENTEPLLSRQLYDSIRRVSTEDENTLKQTRSDLLNSGRMTRDLYDRLQRATESDQGGKSIDLTRELVREGFLPQAQQAGQRARGAVDELRRGVERAAESVLGDDAEQLKLAQSELDSLADQLKRELAQAGAGVGEQGEQQAGSNRPGDQRQAGAQNGQQSPNGERQPGDGAQPGQGEQEGQGQGQQPGDRAGDPRRVASNDSQSKAGQRGGQQRGQGQQPREQGQQGQQPGEGQQGQAQQGQGQGQQGQGRGQGENPQMAQGGQGGRGQTDGARPARPRQLADAGRGRQGGGRDGRIGGIDDLFNLNNGGGGGLGGGEFGPVNVGPLTGDDFNRWVERLRDVEDLVETTELRNALATARERARMIRNEFRQDQKKPDWTVVNLEIVKPLVEVRNRVAEELARRDTKESLAPIDRDPVPLRFTVPVQRYYEELGKEQ